MILWIFCALWTTFKFCVTFRTVIVVGTCRTHNYRGVSELFIIHQWNCNCWSGRVFQIMGWFVMEYWRWAAFWYCFNSLKPFMVDCSGCGPLCDVPVPQRVTRSMWWKRYSGALCTACFAMNIFNEVFIYLLFHGMMSAIRHMRGEWSPSDLS